MQPSVEFDHSNVILYEPEKALALSQFIESTPYIFEAHFTDYQILESNRALVRDHFAILKVGPALTFALGEALFALTNIENELISPEKQSYLLDVIDHVMQDEPKYWQKYYLPQHSKAMVDLRFSLLSQYLPERCSPKRLKQRLNLS